MVAQSVLGLRLAQCRANQLDIYERGMLRNVYPRVTTDTARIVEQAKQHLSVTAFNYLHGGAGELATQEANRAAFRQWRLAPRMMIDTSHRTLETTLFGETYASPLIQAPIGVQSIFHKEKETGLAEVCSELSIPFVLSTAATSTIEEVAQHSGSGPRWYQLYWPTDDEITISLLQRARAANYTALVVTVDTWTAAWRPLDLDRGYLPMIAGVGNQVAFSDPVFRRKFRDAYGKEVEDDIPSASRMWLQMIISGVASTWERLPFLRQHWDGPIILKGIQHPDDARAAVRAGCDGIIVSNHGGRQLDGAVGSLEMLPSIVEAAGDSLTVLFDSGVRTGADILKALCLGAKGVLVGRPVMAGYAIAGKEGAKEVLLGLLTDLDRSMGLAGIPSLKACTPAVLRTRSML
ncbi:hypothetical protein ASPBRDRAFT_189074 [Aspergillus brasiliensis CBS 101740]|uniref:FMN hydroxy acid dehydrogenase domain-containing protein n=1 Tax=Aspergillus brasiliensis (strain CBS 101740 / IMI 381727 / IBT 21946) TaxID=767769 RepID=A0A1L9U3Q6_ASPBC|nr:hypothetical protein ASPBRDRAFT_189074 [Aspergillus brasiliensis CBS 101740]